MNRQIGVSFGRIRRAPGPWWLAAVVGSVLAAGPAYARRSGDEDQNRSGPASRQAARPAAPRAHMPTHAQPVMRESPRAVAPVIRQAPPARSMPPGYTPRSAPVLPAPRSPIIVQAPKAAPRAGAPSAPPVLSAPPAGVASPSAFGGVARPTQPSLKPSRPSVPFSGDTWHGAPSAPPTKAPGAIGGAARSRPGLSWTGSHPVITQAPPRGAGLTPGLDRPTRTPIVSAAAPSDLHFVGDRHGDWGRNSTVFVGVGVGTGLGAWRIPPAPRFTGCFADRGRGLHDPFCHAPCFDPWWARDRWGCWYVRNWGYWPGWWWYPTFYSRVYPCGTFSYVNYCGRRFDWGLAFSFACTPAWGYTSCGLISPSVYAAYEPAPVYTVYSQPSVAVIAPAEQPVVASSASLPAPATPEQLRATTDRELADVYLRLGDSANAIRVYSDHIARFPGDVDAVRSLGTALLESDATRAAEGVAQIERAYAIDPSLAQRPLPRDLLADRLTRALDAAARQAAQDNSARSWLAVAVLMQADGRAGPARSALDKARAAGLNQSILGPMQAALPTGEQ